MDSPRMVPRQPIEEYLADPAWARGDLANALVSLNRMDYERHHREPATPAMRAGSALHCRLLEPERWAREYVLAPTELPLANGEMAPVTLRSPAHREALAILAEEVEAQGKTLIQPEEHALIEEQAASVLPILGPLIEGAVVECSFFWTHEGVPVKTKPDLTLPMARADLKRGSARTPHDFWRKVQRENLALQAAMHEIGAEVHGYGTFGGYHWFLLDDTPPWDVFHFIADRAVIDYGRALLDQACERIRAWMDSKEPERIAPQYITLPKFLTERL